MKVIKSVLAVIQETRSLIGEYHKTHTLSEE